MKKIFIGLLFSCLLSCVFFINSVGAQGDPKQTNYGLDTAQNVAKLPSETSLPEVIGKVLGMVLGFTGTIFFILVVYAGLMWMTAAGNEERVKKAKQVLIAAVIGLIIVLSAYAITRFIGEAVG